MPPRKNNSLEEIEKALASGGGPGAIALVGEDGWLVAEARHRLAAALEATGSEIRHWEGGATGLADELRTGNLFGSGTTFVLEDPEWLVGAGGDGKRRLTALVKSVRDGKGDPAKRLVEILAARGARWDSDDPSEARSGLDDWLAETDADAGAAEVVRGLFDKAVAARLEAPSEADPVAALEEALVGLAAGNRLLLVLGAVPGKTSRANTILPRFEVVVIELPPGDRKEVLARMATLAAKESGVKFAPAAIRILVDRTAPPDRPEARGESDGSIRLFRGELDKLLAAAGPGGAISVELVDSLVADASSVVTWDLDPLIAARDAGGAVAHVRRLLSRKRGSGDGEAMMLLGYLAGQFRKIVGVHHLLDERSVAEAARANYGVWKGRWFPSLEPLLEPGKKDYPLYKATQTAAAFRRSEAEGALRRLAAVDRSVKSGGPPLADQIEGFLLAVVPRRGRRP